jgi:hypothetical protein
MDDTKNLKLYGMRGGQYGNQGSYTYNLPFFHKDEDIVYALIPDKDQPLRKTGQWERDDFVWELPGDVYGDPHTHLVVVSGKEFADKLDLFGWEHDLRSWHEYEDIFYWKLAPEKQYKAERAVWGQKAHAWLLDHITTSTEYDEARIKTAVSFSFVYGQETPEEWIVSTTALMLIGNESRVHMNENHAAGTWHKAEEKSAFASIAEFREALASFQKEYNLLDKITDNGTNESDKD